MANCCGHMGKTLLPDLGAKKAGNSVRNDLERKKYLGGKAMTPIISVTI